MPDERRESVATERDGTVAERDGTVAERTNGQGAAQEAAAPPTTAQSTPRERNGDG